MDNEPYREAGLDGTGQVCGVADSGVNDLSCFFVDDSGAYPTITTNRSGVVEPLRRKVVQYVSHADALDEGAYKNEGPRRLLLRLFSSPRPVLFAIFLTPSN